MDLSDLINMKDSTITRFSDETLDVLALFFNETEATSTRKAYEWDLDHFFRHVTGQGATPELAFQFLCLEKAQATLVLTKYKSDLREQGIAPKTINRRLSTVRSLVDFANEVGLCNYTLKVGGLKTEQYRDTSGVGLDEFRLVIDLCDRKTLSGKRDYALLRLLWSHALRRKEICALDLADFDPKRGRLSILGKGKKEPEWIALAGGVKNAIADWIAAWKVSDPKSPLFVALDPANRGRRLQGDGLRCIVDRYCKKAGMERKMSPHRIRHSSITAALDQGLSVREVQKLSRHKSLDTLVIYDDNRHAIQHAVSETLDNLL